MVAKGPNLLTASHFTTLYIQPIAVGYGYYITNDVRYFGIAVGVLVATVWMHAIFRSIYGPKGPDENPLDKVTYLQRFQATVWNKAPASQYPKDLRGIVKRAEVVNMRRFPLLLISIIAAIVCAFGTATGAYVLLRNIEEVDFIGILLLLGLVTNLLRGIFWRFWPLIHQVEEVIDDEPDTDPRLSEVVDNYGYFLAASEDITVKEHKYNPVAGSMRIKYQTDKSLEEQPNDYRAELKACVHGFAALLERIDYPCHKLDLTTTDKEGIELSFAISAESANKFVNEKTSISGIISRANLDENTLDPDKTDEVLEFQEPISNTE